MTETLVPMRFGDLALVEGTTRNGFVMVTAVYAQYFTGCLVHTAPELAADSDLIFKSGDLTPWPVVVQLDIHGTFFRRQVKKVEGHVPLIAPIIGPVNYAEVADSVGCARGMPLSGRLDGRWRFKEDQLTEEFQPLTAEFAEEFFNGDDDMVFGPEESA